MYRNGGKRLLDSLVASVGLLVLAPWLGILAVCLAVVMRGNPFFVQIRPGRNERLFRLIKFRTMTDERDQAGALLPDERRLTAIGRRLRATSIDELPQLWNVLLGDMSLIGPRPLLIDYLPLYSEDQHRRHHVRPGLTGWAQINGRNKISWGQKFDYDQWYVDHVSLSVDLKILWLTGKSLLTSPNDGSIITDKFTRID